MLIFIVVDWLLNYFFLELEKLYEYFIRNKNDIIYFFAAKNMTNFREHK